MTSISGAASAASYLSLYSQQSNSQQLPQSTGGSTANSTQQDLATLGTDLQSGNISGAEQAFSQLQQQMDGDQTQTANGQTPSASGHHHHHHGGDSQLSQIENMLSQILSDVGGTSSTTTADASGTGTAGATGGSTSAATSSASISMSIDISA